MATAVLRLRITGSPGAYTVSAEVGDEQESDTLGALPDKLRETLQPLQEAILLTTESLRNRALARAHPIPPAPDAARAAPVRGFPLAEGFADAKNIQEIGVRLFDSVFQPEIYKVYKDSLDAAIRDESELHIKLCVEPPELSYVPWETMFDKRGLFYLSCSQRTPFARAATMKELDLHIYDKLPLRVLCMVSAPNDFVGTAYELRTDVEQAALDHALEPLKANNQVKLGWTASGTQRELTTRIIKGDDGEKWDGSVHRARTARPSRVRGRRGKRLSARLGGRSQGHPRLQEGTETGHPEFLQGRKQARRPPGQHRRNAR